MTRNMPNSSLQIQGKCANIDSAFFCSKIFYSALLVPLDYYKVWLLFTFSHFIWKMLNNSINDKS